MRREVRLDAIDRIRSIVHRGEILVQLGKEAADGGADDALAFAEQVVVLGEDIIRDAVETADRLDRAGFEERGKAR